MMECSCQNRSREKKNQVNETVLFSCLSWSLDFSTDWSINP